MKYHSEEHCETWTGKLIGPSGLDTINQANQNINKMRYFFLVLFFIIVVLGVHGDIYKSPYTISQLNSLPSLYSFIPLTPIPGIVSTGLIFPFHTWVHSFSTTFTILLPFLISPPPLYQSPGQDLFYLLVLCFWRKKKKNIFVCLSYYTECFTVTFPYICIITQIGWFPAIFLLSTLVPFLRRFQQV
jgi:hypothetical protein